VGGLNPLIRHLRPDTFRRFRLKEARYTDVALWLSVDKRNRRRMRSMVARAFLDRYQRSVSFRAQVNARLADPEDDDGRLPEWLLEGHLDDLIEQDAHASALLRELQLVPEKLVGDRPAAFDRYDRLSAEGEFRLAAGPPLVAVFVALAAQGALAWWVAVILVAPVVVIAVQGLRREAAAESQLIQSVEAGFPESAELQSIREGNVRWRRELPGDKPSTEQSRGPGETDSPINIG
jgi:hypothetical protein